MTPIQSVLSIYKENSIDFNYELEYHILNGIIFSDNKTMMLAIPSNSNNPETPIPVDKANCIFISMLAGNIKHVVEIFQGRFEFIAFQREFKNSNHTRIYSYEKFRNKLTKHHG